MRDGKDFLDMNKSISDKNRIDYKSAILGFALIFSCIPIFRNYIPDAGEIMFWNERIIGHLGFCPGATVWRIMLFVSQVLFFVSGLFMFKALFYKEKEAENKVFVGMLLYMFCPYRFAVTYEMYDVSEIALWVIIPLFVTLFVNGIKKKNVIFIVASLISLVLAVPFFAVKYVYPNEFFSEGGYTFGQLFSTFFHAEGRPGIGIALILGLALWIYYILEGRERKNKQAIIFALIGTIFVIMSLKAFPWDFFCRKSDILMKVIRHLGSPSFFIGLASIAFTLPASYAVADLKDSENKFVSDYLPVILMVLTVSVWVFLCGKAIYFQYPLE